MNVTFYNPHLNNQSLTGSGQWIADCPFCGKQKHFYMNSKNGLWDCKVCLEKGNWYQFQKRVGSGVDNENEEVKEKKKKARKSSKLISSLESINEHFEERKLLRSINQNIDEKFKYEIPPDIYLPNSFIPIKKSNAKRAYEYLLKRKYNKYHISKYDLMYGTNGIYFNRIIIPVYLDGSLKGYLGRWIPDEELEEVKRKYRNSYKTDFAKLLGNYDLINPCDPVIICEGAFSSYRIDYNSVFSFGKKLSKSQIYLLKKKKVKEVLLLFDSDAQKEIIKLGNLLKGENFTVRILLFDQGDPDDLENEDGKLYERLLDESQILKEKLVAPKIVFKNY